MTRNPGAINQRQTVNADPLILEALLSVHSSEIFRNVAVTGGVCIPRGRVQQIGSLRISIGHHSLRGQADVLNRWSDGSIRWMLISLIIPELDPRAADFLRPPGLLNGPGSPPAAMFRLCISAAEETESEQSLSILKHVDGQIRMTRRPLGLPMPVEHTVDIRPVLTGDDGQEFSVEILQIREDTRGPIRQVIVVSARVADIPFVTLQLRFTVWHSVGLVQVETRIRNTRRARHTDGLWDLGDPGSIVFRSLGLIVAAADSTLCDRVMWRVERSQPLRLFSARETTVLEQFSSGGPEWNSASHVRAEGSRGVIRQGYQLSGATGVERGLRSEPLLAVTHADGFLAVAIPEFWQQFPGNVTVQAGCIQVGLMAETGKQPHELQGGEQKTRSIWLLSGSERPETAELDWVFQPPRLLQSAAAYQQAEAFAWFPGATERMNAECDCSTGGVTDFSQTDDIRRLDRFLRQALTGVLSLAARREAVDEYGWRNFGDVPADHEQQHYAGSGTVISHYNNQFDMVYGAILQMCASGDAGWFELFDPLARHVADIDIYHTDQDRDVYNGGLFWHTDHYVTAHTATHRTYSIANRQLAGSSYGGGPGCEHNYTTGMLYYYFLTGNSEAREAVLSLAEWVLRMDDGRTTVFGLVDDGSTGFASATGSSDYHGPGRGAGNSINALLDAWVLTSSGRFLTKAEQLIRRCAHPRQALYPLNLSHAEARWSYTVFLNAVGRYLLLRLQGGEPDEMYVYARSVMRHYGRWMAANEQRTLSRLSELKYPTAAWAAQDFRKANVLRLAALCDDDPRQAAAMRSLARDLNNLAWQDLQQFGSASLNARCLAILLTEGQRDVFHRTCAAPVFPPPAGSAGLMTADSEWSQAEWVMFVPQKLRVQEMIGNPIGWLKLLIRAARFWRWPQFVRAVQKHLNR